MERFENGVRDLRSALEFLRKRPVQLVETEVEVDPEAELSGVYRYVGAGGTVMRPTRTNGPAMLFRNLKGFDEASTRCLSPACAAIRWTRARGRSTAGA